jgi:hypothetical protein
MHTTHTLVMLRHMQVIFGVKTRFFSITLALCSLGFHLYETWALFY